MQERIYLREWRLTKGLSQSELAVRVGTVKSEISRLERGSRRITADWMFKLSAGLGIALTDLFLAPLLDFSKVPSEHGSFKTRYHQVPTELSLSAGGQWFGLTELAERDWSSLVPGDLCVANRHSHGVTVEGVYLVQLKSTLGLRRASPLLTAMAAEAADEYVSGAIYDAKGRIAVGAVLGSLHAI